MKRRTRGEMGKSLAILLALVACGCAHTTTEDRANGSWPSWRGPLQNGVSLERGLVSQWEPGGENALWEVALPGRGTPVTWGDNLYTLAYRGKGDALVELLVCIDVKTGATRWEHPFPDFLSDIIYDRYAIGSPVVDPATSNVYVMTTNGVIAAFSQNGDLLWSHSMMESFGRLTFPNGRTGSPIIVDGLVIFRGITSNWGRQGPARDRFYAFDKWTGTPAWASTPGVGPKDSSFSTPVLAWRDGRRVFYVGTGCGNIVCVDARTGESIWRFPIAVGGVNASVVVEGDTLVAVHGKENRDSSKTGRMIAIDLSSRDLRAPTGGGTPILSPDAERWRLDISSPTSSPVLYENTVFLVNPTGELIQVNARTGEEQSTLKLGNDQLHASPLLADGRLYIPMRSGMFFVVLPDEEEPHIVSRRQLAGSALGSPSVAGGRIFVHTTERLYAFGNPKAASFHPPPPDNRPADPPGSATTLQIRPNEVLLQGGDTVSFKGVLLDETGNFVNETRLLNWAPWIPPSAKVRAKLDATFDKNGVLRAKQVQKGSAGAFRSTTDDLSGTIRGRVVPRPPFLEDFESFSLVSPDLKKPAFRFAYPPLSWIGARLKWIITESEGGKVLKKTLNRMLFQRSMVFIGHPHAQNYRLSVDVKTDGDRRTRSTVGVINQRYLFTLKGNQQRLEVNSNPNRFRESIPFRWDPGRWYRLTTRVDIEEDGSALLRAKAWPRDEPEPEEWTLVAKHAMGHTHGAPGLFGFTPQNRFSVYMDNIEVKPHD